MTGSRGLRRQDVDPPGRRLLVVGVWALVVVLAATAVTIWWAARHGPDAGLSAAAQDEPAVAWVEVSTRAAPVPYLAGRVRASATQQVRAPLPEGTTSLVVTAVKVKKGSRIGSGQTIAVVSGRPLIAVQGRWPFYRDLTLGDSGDDVRQLQTVLHDDGDLGRVPDGRFGTATDRALRAFYAKRGEQAVVRTVEAGAGGIASGTGDGPVQTGATRTQTAPAAPVTSAVLPVGELVVIPSTSTVSKVAPEGPLGEGDAVAVLTVGAPVVVARADVATVKSFPVGSQVRVAVDGSTTQLTGRVRSVGPFVEGSGAVSDFPGRDVTVALDDASAPPASDAHVTVSLVKGQGAAKTAVPLVALNEDSDGPYVWRRTASDGKERVQVEVSAQADGWALIDGSSLNPGDRVLVAGSG